MAETEREGFGLYGALEKQIEHQLTELISLVEESAPDHATVTTRTDELLRAIREVRLKADIEVDDLATGESTLPVELSVILYGDMDALTSYLQDLLNQPSEMDRLSKAARSHVARYFDRRGNVEAVEEVLLSSAENPRPRLTEKTSRKMYMPEDRFIAKPMMA